MVGQRAMSLAIEEEPPTPSQFRMSLQQPMQDRFFKSCRLYSCAIFSSDLSATPKVE